MPPAPKTRAQAVVDIGDELRRNDEAFLDAVGADAIIPPDNDRFLL
jgi:hypothetical protein